jgi:hypothetical protein
MADSPRVIFGNQPNIRIAVKYSNRTTMRAILRRDHKMPAHTVCAQFWHGTG